MTILLFRAHVPISYTDDILVPFFIHYASEIFLYFLIWCIILYKLNRNHCLLNQYRNDFNAKVAMKSQDKQMILTFLKLKLSEESPFRVYGFQPSTRAIAALFGSLFLPLTVYIVKFVTLMDDETSETPSSPTTIPTAKPI